MGRTRGFATVALLFLLGLPAGARAHAPGLAEGDTRYLVLGDSLGAGQGAVPQLQGYAYLLYREGVFNTAPSTIFSNVAASGGVTSADVLAYQVPLAAVFRPDVVTLTVGGNDLLLILGGADPATVLANFAANLGGILAGLCGLPTAPRIFVSNQYDIPEITGPIPGADFILGLFNVTVDGVVQGAQAAGCDARVVDVHSAFLGREGLLLIDRHGAGPAEVHPTNAGHRVMADAFRDVILSP
jgi:lysophospholipase L1-like esterase